MVFGISPREIFRWSVLAIYGLAMWFIYNGVTEYISLNYHLTWASQIGIGIVIIISIMAYTRYGFVIGN